MRGGSAPDGRWPMFAGPRGIYGGFELLGRTLLPRTPLVGTTRGAFWGTGPFVCPVLVQIPNASTTIEQRAANLDSFIKFLCQLNIINVPLLQASTETLSKLFRHFHKLFARRQRDERVPSVINFER
jgi:hypothetical protein